MPMDFAYSSTSLRELKKCFKSFLWTCKEPWVFVAYVCTALGMYSTLESYSNYVYSVHMLCSIEE